jgi:hypothetical protein
MGLLSWKSWYYHIEMLQLWSMPPAALTSELLAPQLQLKQASFNTNRQTYEQGPWSDRLQSTTYNAVVSTF